MRRSPPIHFLLLATLLLVVAALQQSIIAFLATFLPPAFAVSVVKAFLLVGLTVFLAGLVVTARGWRKHRRFHR